jgi:flavin reductase (DIM6/NTAB) family NADH-FMN oxidoreductase RutF
MIRGAAMNAECKLVNREELGDHVMFIGEVTEISADENIKPLVYHNGRYWRLDDNNKITRPSPELLDKVEQITKKYVKV